MNDRFSDTMDSATGPARHCFAVAPSDTQPLPHVTKALRAGGTGTITFRAVGDEEAFEEVQHGFLAVLAKRYVRAGGSTQIYGPEE